MGRRARFRAPADSSVRSISPQPGPQSTDTANGILVGEASGDAFGTRVAAFDTATGSASLLVTAPLHSVSAGSRHDGAVYRFDDMGSGFTGSFNTLDASLRINGVESGGRFGDNLTICPDIDGDGSDEWLIAATRSNEGAEMAGAVTLILSTELNETDVQTAAGAFSMRWYGEARGERAGQALKCDDDLTGDGVPDLAIGAPFADSPDGVDAVGAVYVLSGASLPEPGPLSEAAGTVLYGLESNDWMGYALATGDIDGNGVTDLIAGAPGVDDASGAVYIWLENVGMNPGFTLSLSGDNDGDGFGRSVQTGELNNDGLDDIVIGTPFLNPTGDKETFDAGSIDIFYGKSTWAGLADRISDAIIEGSDQYHRTGRQVFVGDVDGDERDDLVSVQRTAEE